MKKVQNNVTVQYKDGNISKPLLAVVRGNIFLIIGIIGLIIGNVWCFMSNQRPLHTSTNIVIIILLSANFMKRR